MIFFFPKQWVAPLYWKKSKHFTGPFISRSDGRCVQTKGTQSAQVDDLYLLGIPRWRPIITMIYPQSTIEILRSPKFFNSGKHSLCFDHCSARADLDIEGHHRPVIASCFQLVRLTSPSKKIFESIKNPLPKFLKKNFQKKLDRKSVV